MTSRVARHRTAMSRAALSRPLATALTDQLLDKSTSIFDYGCGRGDDMRTLKDLGYDVRGWDPTFYPDGDRNQADTVNLGYVVNVIEDTRERAETLKRAWSLAARLLIVSARLTWDARDLAGRPLGDGLLTRTGSFQKFFEQRELSEWLKGTLEVQPIAAAPGVFYLFRDPTDAQQFIASRVHTYRPRVRVDPHDLYESNRDKLAPLFEFMNRHARAARPGELADDDVAGIKNAVGSVGRAHRLIRQTTHDAHWEQVARQRRAELLIYVALSRFTRRPRYSELGLTLAGDIRLLFGNYEKACAQADRLLLACGDPALVLVSARSSRVGKQTPTSLYVHRHALGELPPVLQVYEGCARVLSGTVEQANMVKLGVHQPQVSYLSYPHFDRDPHPTLASSVTVNLKSQKVEWRDYSRSENPPLLHRKEEFISSEDPRRDLYSRLTRAELRAGLYANPELIGTLKGWAAELARVGVSLRGHRLVRITPNRADECAN